MNVEQYKTLRLFRVLVGAAIGFHVDYCFTGAQNALFVALWPLIHYGNDIDAAYAAQLRALLDITEKEWADDVRAAQAVFADWGENRREYWRARDYPSAIERKHWEYFHLVSELI